MPYPTSVRTLAAFVSVAVASLAGLSFAHQTIVVGAEGAEQYRVIVGMVREPVFTDERNALDLIVRSMDDEPVPGLEASLSVEFVAPNGAVRRLDVRAQYGRPGHYTDDIMLTAAGVYQIRVTGFIGGIEVDETFATHEVRPLADLAFP
jgi:hypothetical protein